MLDELITARIVDLALTAKLSEELMSTDIGDFLHGLIHIDPSAHDEIDSEQFFVLHNLIGIGRSIVVAVGKAILIVHVSVEPRAMLNKNVHEFESSGA